MQTRHGRALQTSEATERTIDYLTRTEERVAASIAKVKMELQIVRECGKKERQGRGFVQFAFTSVYHANANANYDTMLTINCNAGLRCAH